MELEMDKRRLSYKRRQKSLKRNNEKKRCLKTNSQIPPELQPKEEKHGKQDMKLKRLR